MGEREVVTYAEWLDKSPAGVKEKAVLEAGNRMATEIEERWNGDGRCVCEVCRSAKLWREVVGKDGK